MRDRFFLYAFIAALSFMLFLAGGISTYFKYFPYSWIDEAVMASEALIKQNKIVKRQLREEKKEAKSKSKYKVTINKNKKDASHILINGMIPHGAILISTSGKKLHQWQYDSGVGTYWRDSYAYANGDILVVTENSSKSPHGRNFVKLNKNSKVLWKYRAKIHHTIHITQNNEIMILRHEFSKNRGEIGNVSTGSKYLEDFIVTLDSNGKKLREISILKAILNSPYKKWMHNSPKEYQKWDILHTNSAVTLSKEKAHAFPMFQEGDILISMRSLSAIAVLDAKTEKLKWAKKGKWQMQHDAEFLDDGSIMLFDNRGIGKKEARILKYFPQNDAVEVIHSGTKDQPFISEIMGSQQPLKNGNLFIVESRAKRIFELNPKTKEVIWKLMGPKSKRLISAAHKYPENYFTFLPKAKNATDSKN